MPISFDRVLTETFFLEPCFESGGGLGVAVGQSEIGPIAAEYYGLLKPNRSAARLLSTTSRFNVNRAGKEGSNVHGGCRHAVPRLSVLP